MSSGFAGWNNDNLGAIECREMAIASHSRFRDITGRRRRGHDGGDDNGGGTTVATIDVGAETPRVGSFLSHARQSHFRHGQLDW